MLDGQLHETHTIERYAMLLVGTYRRTRKHLTANRLSISSNKNCTATQHLCPARCASVIFCLYRVFCVSTRLVIMSSNPTRSKHQNISDADFRPLGSKNRTASSSQSSSHSSNPSNPSQPLSHPRSHSSSATDRPSLHGSGGKRKMEAADKEESTDATVPNPLPSRPPNGQSNKKLLQSQPTVSSCEEYDHDEKELNKFLNLHPILSLECTSLKTMELVSNTFQKSAIGVRSLPTIGFEYDSSMLRPPNTQIGERPCVCGDHCIASFMAKIRHGPDTDLAFVATEFLLPEERAKFLAGGGLPPRRKKCLVCSRYFLNWLYITARTDVNFLASSAPLELQSFGNYQLSSDNESAQQGDSQNRPDRPDLVELGRSMAEMPEHASIVHARDGYKPEAMLFVDEEFTVASRAARSGSMASLAWVPVVRFCSSHYKYKKDNNGRPYMIQVGIGSDDPSIERNASKPSYSVLNTLSSFVEPSTVPVAPSAANETPQMSQCH